MRIELILGQTAVGGTERQVVKLAEQLHYRGHHVVVVVINDNGPLSHELDSAGIEWTSVGLTGLSMSRIPWIPTLNSLRGLWRIMRFRMSRWGSTRSDVSHSFLDGAIVIAPLLGGRWRGRPSRVAGVRGFRSGSSLTSMLFGRAVRRADVVVCNAPHLADEMVGGFGVESSQVRVIPNGVDVPVWLADASLSPARGVVVANFQPYKGYDVLLDALTLIGTPVTVHLCGVGKERGAVRSRAIELGIEHKVVFVDPPADVQAELRSAQFAVHPSRTEGMPNAVLEQMAAGLPVIASDVGGIPMLVDEGNNGFLVPAGDSVALARAIEVVASDRELRVSMGAASRAKSEMFSWDACTQAHIDLYTELVTRRSR